jgi:hypothetical protein
MSRNILFISRNDIIRRSPVGGNIDPEKLVPFIKTAQDKYIWIMLGSRLYYYLQDEIAAQTLAATNINGAGAGQGTLAITNTGGTVAINTTAITTTGAQTFNDAANVGANLTLTTSSSNVTFASTLDSSNYSTLTITTG